MGFKLFVWGRVSGPTGDELLDSSREVQLIGKTAK